MGRCRRDLARRRGLVSPLQPHLWELRPKSLEGNHAGREKERSREEVVRDKESRQQEKQRTQIQPQGLKIHRTRDARNERRQAEIGKRSEGHKSKAGNRHWSIGSAQVRSEDAPATQEICEELGCLLFAGTGRRCRCRTRRRRGGRAI